MCTTAWSHSHPTNLPTSTHYFHNENCNAIFHGFSSRTPSAACSLAVSSTNSSYISDRYILSEVISSIVSHLFQVKTNCPFLRTWQGPGSICICTVGGAPQLHIFLNFQGWIVTYNSKELIHFKQSHKAHSNIDQVPIYHNSLHDSGFLCTSRLT